MLPDDSAGVEWVEPSEQHPPAILWHPPGLGALVLQAFPVKNNNAYVRESPRSVPLLLKTFHTPPLDTTSRRTGIAQGLSSSAGDWVCKGSSSDKHSQTHPDLHCHLHSEVLRHFTALDWCVFAVSAAPISNQHTQNQHLHIETGWFGANTNCLQLLWQALLYLAVVLMPGNSALPRSTKPHLTRRLAMPDTWSTFFM